jgi:hypothetical protein
MDHTCKQKFKGLTLKLDHGCCISLKINKEQVEFKYLSNYYLIHNIESLKLWID